MNRLLPVLVAATAVAALPVIAQADHKPGHAKPGPQATGDLSIAAQPNPTIFRRQTVISGRLQGKDNGGRKVVLRADEFPFGDKAVVVDSTTTDAKGTYSFTQRPASNTTYHVLAGASASDSLFVKVRIRIGLRVSDRTPRKGALVRFRGLACPSHDGLLVRIQRKTAKGFRTVRRTRLTDAPRCSKYSRRLRVYRDGTYRTVVDDPDHARGFSPTRFVNVHR